MLLLVGLLCVWMLFGVGAAGPTVEETEALRVAVNQREVRLGVSEEKHFSRRKRRPFLQAWFFCLSFADAALSAAASRSRPIIGAFAECRRRGVVDVDLRFDPLLPSSSTSRRRVGKGEHCQHCSGDLARKGVGCLREATQGPGERLRRFHSRCAGNCVDASATRPNAESRAGAHSPRLWLARLNSHCPNGPFLGSAE